jgi:hypothetical protein
VYKVEKYRNICIVILFSGRVAIGCGVKMSIMCYANCCAMFSCCFNYVISYEKSIMGSENTYASCVCLTVSYCKNLYKTYNILIIKCTEINQMSSTLIDTNYVNMRNTNCRASRKCSNSVFLDCLIKMKWQIQFMRALAYIVNTKQS